MSSKISIVIPAHNEEENLVPLVDSIINLRRKQRLNYEVMIVDDNSTDKTGKIADSFSRKYKGIKVIHRKGNRGMGNALKEGTKKAKGDIVVWVMADRADDLNTIPKMIEKIEQGYDVVFGSRYTKGGSRGDLDPFKTLASSGYTKVASIIFGFKLHDITNAFRAFRKDVFNKLNIESGDFAISPEFAIKAHLKKYKLGEVPTTHSKRKAGKATFKMLKMGWRYGSLFKYRFSL